MCLPRTEVEHFYSIWRPLLYFVNQRLNLVPSFLKTGPAGTLNAEDAVKIRDAVWSDPTLLDTFIKENPANLSAGDLSIAASWKQHRQGDFFIFKPLKKYAILINQRKTPEVFAVKGLYDPFDKFFGPNLPTLVKTVLLPFGDEIIYDGLMSTYNLLFGSGIRGELKDIYDDAKERGEIITSLNPAKQPLSREDQIAKARATNEKVLDDFRKHLYQSGKSTKTVERDIATIAGFAASGLEQPDQPVSLRDISTTGVENYLAALTENVRRPVITGLKRFVSFMRDTGRLDWEEAEDLLILFKGL